jgi:PhzF family phenazine biosynthesis protein
MKKFQFKKIDAFTSGASSGNPAGYIELNSSADITESEMQQIAFELKNFVSEVGYVSQSQENGVDFDFRYFSCEKEVPFCGHATVAICYELAKENKNFRSKSHFRIRTKKGILRIENKIESENLVYIQAPPPAFIKSSIDLKYTAAALGISEDEIDSSRPSGIVNAGQNTLMVPIISSAVCINCAPDYMTLREYSLKNNIEIINIYTSDTINDQNHLRTRVFAPAFGYLEDPATGSGNAALGYFLIKHKIWTSQKMIIEQGVSRDNPNIVVLLKINDNEIKIGGRAVTRINGEYILTGDE